MMNRRTTQSVLVLGGVVVLLFGMTTQVEACQFLDRLFGWCGCGGSAVAATTYAPPYVPAATPAVTTSCPTCPTTTCAPCATQTCCYVPQTCYRTVYRVAPVTTCQAVTGCDPCTGCPTTCYRPVTQYVRSAQLIPYTTYRAVWQTNLTPVCPTPCATSACGYTSATVPTTLSSGCTSCAPTTTVVAPVADGAPSLSTPPSTSAPSGTTPSTFKTDKPVLSEPLKPIPDEDRQIRPNSLQTPRLISPSDRLTARPIQRATYYQPVGMSAPASRTGLDTSGWRAASK